MPAAQRSSLVKRVKADSKGFLLPACADGVGRLMVFPPPHVPIDGLMLLFFLWVPRVWGGATNFPRVAHIYGVGRLLGEAARQ